MLDYQDILREVECNYGRNEFPVLLAQCEEWSVTKPFAGRKLIDATPVFLNTCAKYAALIAGGADLSVARPGVMPHDPDVLGILPKWGIPVVDAEKSGGGCFDVVLDCAGSLSSVPSRYGYVELTKSGEYVYEKMDVPVWMVDSGLVKRIETSLGTGESFFRAMRQLGYVDWKGRRLLVIGYGKVGRGIVINALDLGCDVTVADVDGDKPVPEGVGYVSVRDRERFHDVLSASFCAVTATGVMYAMEGYVDSDVVCKSSVLLANMGVEDEWGRNMETGRVLNDKKPVNFILQDPTRMCYIDPPMALHNYGALKLLEERPLKGMYKPSGEIERLYIDVVKKAGVIPSSLLNGLTCQEPS